MRIVQINAVPYGSTGRIMFHLADELKNENHEVLCTAGFTWKKTVRDDFFLTSGLIEKTVHMLLSRITGFHGCFSRFATRKFLKKIDLFRPDIIHLHNIHGWYINIPMLFNYLKRNPEIKVIWTLHDCWSVTGHCAHFMMANCDKWKTECKQCAQYHLYPKTIIDQSCRMYHLKKGWFSGIPNMTIVTPSEWLKSIVKQSYLKEYRVEVINNGIDLTMFRPIGSSFRSEHGLQNKYIILGVAYAWDNKKGLDVFVELSGRLPDNYVIVLVGTDENVDKVLPQNILSIHQTQNQTELAEIYSAADVFVNPTKEENYPTVHLESIACGTPVITFDTGGAKEMLTSECGSVIEYNNIDEMERKIIYCCEKQPFSEKKCVQHAQNFEASKRYREYIDLYKSVL